MSAIDRGYALPEFVRGVLSQEKTDLQQLHQAVKVLKRELKGDVSEEKLQMIRTAYEKIDKLFQETVTSGLETGGLAQSIDKLAARLQQKERVAAGRANVAKLQGTEAKKPIDLTALEGKLSSSSYVNPKLKYLVARLSTIHEKIYLRNGAVTGDDLKYLKEALALLDSSTVLSPEEVAQLKTCIGECINTIEKTALNKMKLMLVAASLAKVEANKNADANPTNKEAYQSEYAKHYQHILSNPFEIVMDLNSVALQLDEDAVDNLDQEVLNVLPEEAKASYNTEIIFIKEAKNFSTEMQKTFQAMLPNGGVTAPQTRAEKIAALKFMMQYQRSGESKGEVLITGGGPGGLMTALLSMMQGHPVTLLEARGENDKMRQNIVALGKEADVAQEPMLEQMAGSKGTMPADIKLLDFFGVTDGLKEAGKSTEMADGVLQVKIEDVQKELLQTAKDIAEEGQFSVHYNASVEALVQGEDGKPAIVYRVGDQQVTCQPAITYVMEGYRATTRDLLGIDVIKESKVARMGFSFYEVHEAKTSFKRLMTRFMAVLATVPRMFRLGTKFLMGGGGGADAFGTIFKCLGRGELLLSTPELQYFYFTMSEKEEKELKAFEEQIQTVKKDVDLWADDLLKNLEGMDPAQEGVAEAKEMLDPKNRGKLLRTPEKLFEALQKIEGWPAAAEGVSGEELQKLAIQMEKLGQDVDDFLKSISKKDYLINMMAYKALGISEGLAADTSYKETVAAASQVQRAETNHVSLGSIHFVLGGDAETATDPVSGAGMRTTLLRAAIATVGFSSGMAKDPVGQALYQKSAQKEAKSMREEGLHGRQYYRKGSERMERYLSMAEAEGFITREEFNQLLQIQGKIKSRKEGIPIEFSPAEEELISKVKGQLKNSFPASSRESLTKEEGALLEEMNKADWVPEPEKRQAYQALLAKLAFESQSRQRVAVAGVILFLT